MPLLRSPACPLSRTRLEANRPSRDRQSFRAARKFVGALPNLLLNRDQDGRFVRLRGECGLGSGLVRVLAGSFLFLDLVGMAIYPFSQLFSLPL